MTDRLLLPSVTLVAVTSVAIAATAHAVARCIDQVQFGAVLWLSDQPPPDEIAGQATWHQIPQITSRAAYSEFLLHRLIDFIATDHVLCVQWDGYVLAADEWDPSFLQFDYIGAIWPHFRDSHIVGNGGFSLRSRKMLASCLKIPLDAAEAEDVTICRTWRPTLEAEDNIQFAPPSLASRFAFERQKVSHKTFGFHGVFNLVDLVPRSELRRLLRNLEPSLLAPNEQRELFAWAFRHGEWRIMWWALRRILDTRRARQKLSTTRPALAATAASRD